MNRFLLSLALGFLTFAACAQTSAVSAEAAPLDSLTKLSQQFINNQQADSLYALMGPAFKQQISLEKTKEVLTQLSSLGRWTASEPKGIQAGVAKYRAKFALAPLDFYIARDANGKISTFAFKPAED